MENLSLKIHKLLLGSGKTLAVAESCTGGLLSSYLTQFPGSSQYYLFGAVTYSNKAKQDILKIPRSLILNKGAVSENVASAMAKGVRKIARADFGIGITGIAGPTGGTLLKPIGTVFIALSRKNKTICKKFHFTGNRTTIREKSALKVLELLKKLL